jgi:phage tail-like protein
MTTPAPTPAPATVDRPATSLASTAADVPVDPELSTYLAHLPRAYADDPGGGAGSGTRSTGLPRAYPDEPFLGRFLLAFEAVLTGLPSRPGLQQAVDGVVDLLDPATTREEFLPWLAGWVGLGLRADWDVPTRRAFVAEIVPLYRLRGTREGLRRMLTLYTGQPVEIDDELAPPHFFTVRLTLAQADPDQLRRIQQIARAIVDQEKPSHTFYALEVATPTMRLVSTDLQARETKELKTTPPLLVLGRNTLLGVGRAGS